MLPYLPVLLFVIVGLGFGAVTIGLSTIIVPALAPEGAKRLRRLGRKGEGVTATARAPNPIMLMARVTPSPRFSNLATLAKRNGPPPPRGRGRPRVERRSVRTGGRFASDADARL